jgi:hypothetical protein
MLLLTGTSVTSSSISSSGHPRGRVPVACIDLMGHCLHIV